MIADDSPEATKEAVSKITQLLKEKRGLLRLVASLELKIADPKTPNKKKADYNKRRDEGNKRIEEIDERLIELHDDEPATLKKIREEADRGTLHVPSLPELLPNENDSINPGQMAGGVNLDEDPPEKIFPALKPITDRLDKIHNDALKGPIDPSPELKIQIGNIRTAFLYKAIAENWPLKTLYTEYERAMAILYDKSAKDRPVVYWVGGKLYRAFNSLWSGPEKKHLGDPNRFLTDDVDREIKPGNRAKIESELKSLDHTEKRFIFKGCYKLKDGKWDFDSKKVDTDKVNTAEKKTIPFFREFLINSAIVEKWPKTKLIEKYTAHIDDIYKKCKKNMTDDERQAREDEAREEKEDADKEQKRDEARAKRKEKLKKEGKWGIWDDVGDTIDDFSEDL